MSTLSYKNVCVHYRKSQTPDIHLTLEKLSQIKKALAGSEDEEKFEKALGALAVIDF